MYLLSKDEKIWRYFWNQTFFPWQSESQRAKQSFDETTSAPPLKEIRDQLEQRYFTERNYASGTCVVDCYKLSMNANDYNIEFSSLPFTPGNFNVIVHAVFMYPGSHGPPDDHKGFIFIDAFTGKIFERECKIPFSTISSGWAQQIDYRLRTINFHTLPTTTNQLRAMDGHFPQISSCKIDWHAYAVHAYGPSDPKFMGFLHNSTVNLVDVRTGKILKAITPTSDSPWVVSDGHLLLLHNEDFVIKHEGQVVHRGVGICGNAKMIFFKSDDGGALFDYISHTFVRSIKMENHLKMSRAAMDDTKLVLLVFNKGAGHTTGQNFFIYDLNTGNLIQKLELLLGVHPIYYGGMLKIQQGKILYGFDNRVWVLHFDKIRQRTVKLTKLTRQKPAVIDGVIFPIQNNYQEYYLSSSTLRTCEIYSEISKNFRCSIHQLRIVNFLEICQPSENFQQTYVYTRYYIIHKVPMKEEVVAIQSEPEPKTKQKKVSFAVPQELSIDMNLWIPNSIATKLIKRSQPCNLSPIQVTEAKNEFPQEKQHSQWRTKRALSDWSGEVLGDVYFLKMTKTDTKTTGGTVEGQWLLADLELEEAFVVISEEIQN